MNAGDFIKHPETEVVLNTNISAINAAKERKRKKLEEKKRIQSLENDVTEIKSMLSQILGKLDGKDNL